MLDMQFYEAFDSRRLSLKRWQELLGEGWDRVGTGFFRQRFFYDNKFPTGRAECMPVRYNLTQPVKFNKNQQKIIRQNEDLKLIIQPVTFDDEQYALFDKWESTRFGLGSDLHVWVVSDKIPFRTHQTRVYRLDKLVAVSFFDIAHKSQYSTVAAYDPDEMNRNLGTFTLLKEIEFGMKKKRHFHHPGYAYYNYGAFDYKKQFPNPEYFSWYSFSWKPLTEKFVTQS